MSMEHLNGQLTSRTNRVARPIFTHTVSAYYARAWSYDEILAVLYLFSESYSITQIIIKDHRAWHITLLLSLIYSLSRAHFFPLTQGMTRDIFFLALQQRSGERVA